MSQSAPNQPSKTNVEGDFKEVTRRKSRSPKKGASQNPPKTPPPGTNNPFGRSSMTPRTPPKGGDPEKKNPASGGKADLQQLPRQQQQGAKPKEAAPSTPSTSAGAKRPLESPEKENQDSRRPRMEDRQYDRFLVLTTEITKNVALDKMSATRKFSILDSITKIQEMYLEISRENAALKAEVGTLKTLPTPQEPKSYSAAVATPASPAPPKARGKTERASQKPGCTLFITGKDGEAVKEVQNHLTRNVNPRKEKIKIKSMRTTKNVLILETETQEDANKIMQNEKISEKLKCEPPRKRRPLLILYDVPSDATNEELVDTIYEQNFEGEVTKEQFTESFKLKFKTGPREKPTVHHVAEVDPVLRKKLMVRRKIYIGFRSVNIKDYQVVARCLKCQDLGHVAKFCIKTSSTCAHCGEEDHSKAQCEKKDQPATCIPCKRRGKKCTKKGTDCLTYTLLLERQIQRTDYGC